MTDAECKARCESGADAPPGAGVLALATVAPTPSLALSGMLEDGEVVILLTRPSIWFIFLKRLGSFAAAGCVSLVAVALDALDVLNISGPAIVAGSFAAVALTMLWFMIDRSTRLYLLTDRRVLRVSGVFRQTIIEAPLRHVQSVTLYRSFRERLFGIGTVVFSTAAAGGSTGEFSWFMAPAPFEAIKAARDTLGRYGK